MKTRHPKAVVIHRIFSVNDRPSHGRNGRSGGGVAEAAHSAHGSRCGDRRNFAKKNVSKIIVVATRNRIVVATRNRIVVATRIRIDPSQKSR